LKAKWETKEEARFDAGYFSGRSYCGDWTPEPHDRGCSGGIHTVGPRKEEPEELAWAIDLAV